MTRNYKLKRRFEQQEETRRRIVQATVDLHTTIGPARTSISAIAERAGVERPTVYRHFPTSDALFTACSSHHWTQNPGADPEPWLRINRPDARLRKGLGEIYAYYSIHELELWNVLRDLEDKPEIRRFAVHRERHRERVLEVLANAWPAGKQARLRFAVLGHAVDFFTWRSLRRQGLTNDEAVELMVELARNV